MKSLIRLFVHLVCALIFMVCMIATVGLILLHMPKDLMTWPALGIWFLLQGVGFWSSANSMLYVLRNEF